jgi:hypothetical protein
MKRLFASIKEEIKSWDKESVLFIVGGVTLACLILKVII